MWIIYALLSAVFAALTTILAKIGVKNVDSTLATAIRTAVVLVMAWGMASCWKTGRRKRNRRQKLGIPYPVRTGDWRFVAVLLQGPADGRGQPCGSDRQAERCYHDDSGVCCSARDRDGLRA